MADLQLIEKAIIAMHYHPDTPETNPDKWTRVDDVVWPDLNTKLQLFHSELGAGTGHLYIYPPLTLNEDVPRLYWEFQKNGAMGCLDIPFTDNIVTHYGAI